MAELFQMFPDEKTAMKWFETTLWKDGRKCPRCGSSMTSESTHRTMPYRCVDCKQFFSVKMGTIMERSKISYQSWAIATYLFATNLKGVSSMKLHRDLGITQKSAWFMVHRLRESWGTLVSDKMEGSVEIDESYFGGKEKNKHGTKRLNVKGGSGGKTAVVGMKDRKTGMIRAEPLPDTTAARLGKFIQENAKADAVKYTDDNPAYRSLKNHGIVKHSVGEYVKEQAHTNGIESFWAILKRGYYGIFHHVSAKHLHRYVNEFAWRFNIRVQDTISMMESITRSMTGHRLTYQQLIS